MPFKGDENMLVDGAKDRAALDDEEGDNQLLIGLDLNTKPNDIIINP
jgi:hypothetical protein